MTRLLLADDDRALSDLLREYFAREGFAVTQVYDGAAAVAAAAAHPHDAIILDVMMPVMDGFEALRLLRAAADTPILMLTARGEDIDRILGLEMGADDYLAKPCNPRELLARIKAILRRSRPGATSPTAPALTVGGVTLEPSQRQARTADAELPLTATELDLLEYLMRCTGRLASKHALSEEVLGRPLGRYDRSLDMHISHLRKKLEAAAAGVRIHTRRGEGFMLSADHAAGGDHA